MALSSAPRTIELKTVSGRKCSVEPPFTVQHLVDVAVEQLHFERESVKLFVGNRLIYARRRENLEPDQHLLGQVTVPEGDGVLVMGRPALGKKTHATKAKDVGAARQVVDAKKPFLTPAAFAADDGMDIGLGPKDKGLYRFLKPLVFMLGRRGLRHFFLLVKGQRGHFPESFQNHPVMVCIVEYVDRDPSRLKEVLTTIQEEVPGLLRWIETHAEFFLNAINTPPQWRDDTSPMWLIRHAKRLYSMEANMETRCKNILTRVTTSYRHAESFSEEFTDNETSPRENGILRDMDFSGTSSSFESCAAPLEGTSSSTVMKYTNKNVSQEEDCMTDLMVQELQMVYRAWELAKERSSSVVGNTADGEDLKTELLCRLRAVHTTLLRTMECYLMTPTNSASLSKLFLIGQQSWSEGEEWFIEQGDVYNAFVAALGRLLFNSGKDLITAHIPTRQQEKKVVFNNQSPLLEEFQLLSALDPTTRWITENGPSVLARQLREYSLRQSVSIVIYSKISCNQLYAYVVRDGDVKGAPIVLDEDAGLELNELQRLYEVISQTHPPKDAIKIRRAIRSRWNDLLERLYRRLLSPIEGLLPPPAPKAHVPLSEVSQLCFIDTWAPCHIPIPFPALWNPANGASCLLQWAVFKANRPWDLICSAEVPWSSPLANSPVITRVFTPATVWPTMSVSEGTFRPGTHMVTYVNTSGVGFASMEDTTPIQHWKGGNDMEKGGLWQNVPWECWLGRVLGTVRAGIPTYAFMKGKDSAQSTSTALFIHEVSRTEREGIASTTSSSSSPSSSDETGKMILVRREMPYNQCSDLFVSHVVGRDSGVGIHRAAVLPVFKVAGRDPAGTYASFLKALVATNEMTAAKAYRLAILLSWQTDCREEPWRSTSVMLFNYGGAMNTLGFLHEEYCKRRYLKAPRVFACTDAASNDDTENRHPDPQPSKYHSRIRNTVDGHYVEKHGIDVIYDVVLHGLSASRPQGEVAILDNMIQCIEKNRSTLEECVESHSSGKVVARTLEPPPVESFSAPSSNSDGAVSIVSAMRTIVKAARSGGANTGSSALPAREIRPSKGDQPSNGRKPPPGS
ncbi:hypothetical protein TRSC58_05278 [Trypanosoma rangeli SC58]|uniref:XPC-binding domain-containing protein n=1 Tax=Trypanosoma rangeli SC58 TaxID=429131 RepID=A0A061IWJ8_TRYRA|nr:hypothetical protein TRSC58_05278 [Trypanosoma rangeli SC58]